MMQTYFSSNAIAVGRKLACLGLICATLASCGNDNGAREDLDTGVSIFKQIRQSLKPAESPIAPEALAQYAMQTLQGPLLMVIVEDGNVPAVLQPIQRNRGYTTWAAANFVTLTINGDMITGTRGLGYDIMSSDAGAVTSLLRARRNGTVSRTWRHIDGEGNETPMTLRCTVSTAGAETIRLTTGAVHSTTRMEETCSGPDAQVQNTYWVSGSGAFTQSRQWISEQFGSVMTQKIRN